MNNFYELQRLYLVFDQTQSIQPTRIAPIAQAAYDLLLVDVDWFNLGNSGIIHNKNPRRIRNVEDSETNML